MNLVLSIAFLFFSYNSISQNLLLKNVSWGQTEATLRGNKNLSLINRSDYDSTSEIKFDTYCPFYIDSFNIAGHRFSVNLIFSTKTKKLARIAFMLKQPKAEKIYDNIPVFLRKQFGTAWFDNITPVSDEKTIADERTVNTYSSLMEEMKWKNQHSAIDLIGHNIYIKKKGNYKSLTVMLTDLLFLEELEKEKGPKDLPPEKN
jgi:hypothetical protein